MAIAAFGVAMMALGMVIMIFITGRDQTAVVANDLEKQGATLNGEIIDLQGELRDLHIKFDDLKSKIK